MSRAIRLGLFILGALVVLAIGIFLIGSKEMLFNSTYTVKANFKTVAGLDNGSDVRVGGMHEGTVKRIILPPRPDQEVTVEMSVDKRTHDVLKKDSVAAIKSEGLMGDKFVEITFGSPEAESLKNGDTINTAPPVDISDLINKMDTLLDSSQAAVKNIEGTASNMEAISSNIKQGKGTVGALINDKTMYQQATAGATEFAENMEALKHNFFLRGFFKRRGYEDADELTKHQIGQLPAEQPEKTFDFDTGQIFTKPDAAKLKNKKALDQAGQFLQQNPYGMVVITASAGMLGDSQKDKQLTEAQAMVVRDYLTQNYRFDDTRVKTLGRGKTEEEGRKLSILVYSGKAGLTEQNTKTAKR